MVHNQPGCPTTARGAGHDSDRHDSANKSANCVRAEYIRSTAKLAIVTLAGRPREVRRGVKPAKELVLVQEILRFRTVLRQVRGKAAAYDMSLRGAAAPKQSLAWARDCFVANDAPRNDGHCRAHTAPTSMAVSE